jgi:hypothetical protein
MPETLQIPKTSESTCHYMNMNDQHRPLLRANPSLEETRRNGITPFVKAFRLSGPNQLQTTAPKHRLPRKNFTQMQKISNTY